ncbi:7454_t:CDS:2 [Dentiscutata erythropus]|uniref:7454_t:CDS:1 n=1 Tax=Dentiscutata erythropus TaxID=1348616 RepID=A0A9N9CIV6_9GLOM|nr:7454_t:CDS:2 [Dentiscutata erythropus]
MVPSLEKWLKGAIKNNQVIQYDNKAFNDRKLIRHGSYREVFSATSPKFKTIIALKSIIINPSFTMNEKE